MSNMNTNRRTLVQPPGLNSIQSTSNVAPNAMPDLNDYDVANDVSDYDEQAYALPQSTLPPPDAHPSEFRYHDGCANGYSVWLQEGPNGVAVCFAYDPVTPMTSCSGTYSGGEPVKTEGKVPVAKYKELLALVEEEARDDSSLAEARFKGTGEVGKHPRLSELPIFAMNSSAKSAIERLLADMKYL